MKEDQWKQIHPEWVSGFCQAEACFYVSFTRRLYRKIKIEVRPGFSITQRTHSKIILFALKDYFKCGAIRYSKRDGMFRYEVRSVPDLVNHVIPHFQNYRFVSGRDLDFVKFEKVCFLLHNNQTINPENLIEIIELSYSMNFLGKRKYLREDLLKLISS